jgi:hypothetical protein
MRYSNGRQVQVGDVVRLGLNWSGIVVCSIDDGHYTSDFLESEWSYLKAGILVKSAQAGLMHIIQPDEDFEFVGRASPVAF